MELDTRIEGHHWDCRSMEALATSSFRVLFVNAREVYLTECQKVKKSKSQKPVNTALRNAPKEQEKIEAGLEPITNDAASLLSCCSIDKTEFWHSYPSKT